jgi:hypothetical protein
MSDIEADVLQDIAEAALENGDLDAEADEEAARLEELERVQALADRARQAADDAEHATFVDEEVLAVAPELAQEAYDIAEARLPALNDVGDVFAFPPGSVHLRGLVLTDTAMEFDDWTRILHNIGEFSESSRFWLGDTLAFGADLFGEDHAQAVEGTPQELYDVAHRITGLKVPTLENYASLCRSVPLDVRRVELGFTVHEAVRALDRDEQVYWLNEAVVNGWDRETLRAEIRAAKKGEPVPEKGQQEILDRPVSLAQRALEVLNLVAHQGQPTSDGGAVISAEVWAQVQAVIGED